MSTSVDRPRPNHAQAAAAYDVVARREALPVNTPTSVLEACRSVVAATLFYGTDLYHYVYKSDGKYTAQFKVRGINFHTPTVASAELAAALVTTALEARRPASFKRLTRVPTRRPRAGVPQARRRRGPREAGLQGPQPGPLGPRRARSDHKGHGLRPYMSSTHSSSVAQVQSKVRAAFAAGASGKKKLNKREQKDARGPRPII